MSGCRRRLGAGALERRMAMRKAEEDLKAILELQREWCQTYGYKYLSTAIVDECRGFANTDSSEPNHIDVEIGYEETPAAGTAGESR